MKHKQGKINIVVDALSRRHSLLSMLETKLLELYLKDKIFKEIYDLCANGENVSFYIYEWFLFEDKKLYVPKSSIRGLFVKKAHEGGLIRHFREYKTYNTLLEHFFLSSYEA
ncbi:hypothetical protein CR513_01749, partial [Mucuna pruriens]